LSARPEPAATIALLRESDGKVEALLIRRHVDLNFLGGMWVFPGGKVDAADDSAEAARMLGDAVGPPRRRFFTAALRELFEETGLLLATNTAGEPVEHADIDRVRGRVQQAGSNAAAFFAALDMESLRLDCTNVIEWANWITPSAVPRRFDTHFFVGAAPASQRPQLDLSESTETHWQNVADVSPGWRALKTLAPTLFTMLELAESLRQHGSLGALLRAERGRQTPALLPKSIVTQTGAEAVYPWDPAYDELPGEGLTLPKNILAHYAGRPSRWAWAR
jgi:8-oxo-dGTP pyrophosphatase MutT (NUDIX family)